MEDLGFIAWSWIAALGSSAALAVWVVRSGRRLARQLPDEDKPWT
jgi:hypothetical protein